MSSIKSSLEKKAISVGTCMYHHLIRSIHGSLMWPVDRIDWMMTRCNLNVKGLSIKCEKDINRITKVSHLIKTVNSWTWYFGHPERYWISIDMTDTPFDRCWSDVDIEVLTMKLTSIFMWWKYILLWISLCTDI